MLTTYQELEHIAELPWWAGVVPSATALACLKVRKLSLREAKSLTQGYRAGARTHKMQHLT